MTGFNTSPGIVSDPLLRNEEQWRQGLENYKPPLSAVLGATFDEAITRGPLASALRSSSRAMAQGGVIGYEGSTIELPLASVLSAKEANERFAIAGHLKFDGDTPEPVARELYDLKRAEIVRQDITQRSPGGLVQGAAVLGTSLVASALDPLNVASAFLPVVGEARMAAWLARAGESAMARAGARAGAGAIEGVAGQALVLPITYGVARQEQADYHAVDALLDLAVGGVLGAGLHAGAGAIADKFRPRLTKLEGDTAAPTLGEQIAAAPLETREAAMRSAIAQLADTGKVDNVEAILRAEATRLNLDHLMSTAAAIGDVPPPKVEFALPAEGPTRGASAGRQVNRPLDIFEFIAAQGGLAPHGDLSSMGLDKSFIPGYGRLVREGGLDLDRARALAEEAGYIGGAGVDYQTTDLNHLLDALDTQARGKKVYSLNELEQVHEREMAKRIAHEHEREAEALREVHAVAKEHGITLTDNEARELGELVRQGKDPVDAVSDILDRAMHDADTAAAAHAKEKGIGDGFEIPFEPRAEEPTGREAPPSRAASAEAQPTAADGAREAGEQRGGAREEASGRGAKLELEDNPALASALEAARQADAELENLKAAGLVTGEEPELAAAVREVELADMLARGYEAAGACLGRG